VGNPSSNIAFGLIAGFIVFITVRGELPAYLCVVGIGSNCPPVQPVQTVNKTSVSTPPSTNQPPTAANNGPSGGSGGGGFPSTSITAPSGTFSDIGAPVGMPTAPGWELPELPAPDFPAPPGVAESTLTFPGIAGDAIGSLGSGYQIDYGNLGNGTYEGGYEPSFGDNGYGGLE